jgi:hypothetical protein
VIAWLTGDSRYDRPTPKAFEKLLYNYKRTVGDALAVSGDGPAKRWAAHRLALSGLTDVLFGVDLRPELASRLTQQEINPAGFRTTLSQGVAKNTGEHFINLTAYALADALRFQDEVLVEKGLPPQLRSLLTLLREVETGSGPTKTVIKIPLEVDLCVYLRSDPSNAILVSAKTRLKEVFHIAVMWKFFFDFFADEHCLSRWGLRPGASTAMPITRNMIYTFATADMIRKTGRETQGPDIERGEVRNLINMDASFMDYVFVSKRNIAHLSASLTLRGRRESLFHELGCLLDLTQQKFDLQVPSAEAASKPSAAINGS